MIRVLMLAAAFVVVVGVVGSTSQYSLGVGPNPALAQEYGGGPPDDPPNDCCEEAPEEYTQEYAQDSTPVTPEGFQDQTFVLGEDGQLVPYDARDQDFASIALGGREIDFTQFGNFGQFSAIATVDPADRTGLVGEVPEMDFDFSGFFSEFDDATPLRGPDGEVTGIGELAAVFGKIDDFDGEYNDFANFGGDFSELGEFFQRSDAAKEALAMVMDLTSDQLSNSGLAHDLISNLDFFALHDLDSSVVEDLLHSAEQAGEVMLDGEQWKGILGSLDHEGITGLSEQLKDSAYDAIDGNGFLLLPPENAAAFFESSLLGEDTDFAAKLAELGDDAHNLLAAADHDFYSEIADKMEEVFDSIDFQGLDLGRSALDGSDIGAILGEMGDALVGKDSDDILAALAHTDASDLLVIEAGVAADLIAAIGLGEIAAIAQFDGLVANLTHEEIVQDLGQDLRQVINNLDFGENSDLLAEFSLNALDTITGGDLPDLDLGDLDQIRLADLANSVGGGQIFTLAPEQLRKIVLTSDPIGIQLFDEDVVEGVFAGLNVEQITGFDQATLESALEAAHANFLGGVGDFASIAGGDTAYDLIAESSDIAQALIEDGSFTITNEAVDLFRSTLFGTEP